MQFHDFERFLIEYEGRFERKYGYLRPIIKEVVERYLDWKKAGEVEWTNYLEFIARVTSPNSYRLTGSPDGRIALH